MILMTTIYYYLPLMMTYSSLVVQETLSLLALVSLTIGLIYLYHTCSTRCREIERENNNTTDTTYPAVDYSSLIEEQVLPGTQNV